MTAPGPTANATTLLLQGVGKTYGRHRALIDVSTTFVSGRVATVLGPNGAGKSTMLGILSTLVGPTTGRLIWGGQQALRTSIGYVGHEPGVYGDLTAQQNLALFAGLYGVSDGAARVQAMLDRVGLRDARPDAPSRTFSRGMLQRLSLARALLHGPQILLFDEPASTLDPAGAAWLTTEIRNERAAGRLIILVTHDLDAAAAVADQVLVVRRGRLLCDETRPGGFSSETVRALYQEKTRGAA